MTEPVAELPEEIETGYTCYRDPAGVLAPYLDLLRRQRTRGMRWIKIMAQIAQAGPADETIEPNLRITLLEQVRRTRALAAGRGGGGEAPALTFGEAADEIGFAKPLGDYSEAEALQVIDAIVTCYTEAMVAHHEASKYPPVRGMTPAPDPLANPFADLEDDLPWEEPKGKKP